MSNYAGKLILLTLPIGNLEDITYRAKSALQSGQTFFVEDTRNFKSLLALYKIDFEGKKILSFHDHSKEEDIKKILNELIDKDVYLCSDAGSPIISDPAYPIVKRCLEVDVQIDSYSGISSVINALELSGIAPHPFTFYGFFPRDAKKQKEVMQKMNASNQTCLFFESPQRIISTLKLIKNTSKKFELTVLRELTKKFQSLYHMTQINFDEKISLITAKGEFVVIFHGFDATNPYQNLEDLAKTVLEKKGKQKDLAKLLSEILGKSSKDIYKNLTS